MFNTFHFLAIPECVENTKPTKDNLMYQAFDVQDILLNPSIVMFHDLITFQCSSEQYKRTCAGK